ncbi:sulfotransferase domain-containing protein [Candidatus Pelagibacter sp.]|uniref:sulfotransferase domain-containing protein n=1 Tax=Candidatus Pelagibacter sp. TaxID=2024849 RepID=UPI003F86740E
MIIWLASYPKSGNTWVRSMLTALIYTNDGKFNFDLLDKIKQFPSQIFFKDLTNRYDDVDEIAKNWETAQDLINLNKEVKFLKTHHLKCKIGENNFTSQRNTLATIYIVRDPRNLVNSISNHYSKSLEESKKFLMTPRYLYGFKKNGDVKKNDIKTLLGTWSQHYNFWKTNNTNYLLIRYEDLIKDTNSALNKIIVFLKKYINIEVNDKKIKNILNTTNFQYLKNLENEGKFNENAFENINTKKTFFYLGPKNNWKNNLDEKMKKEIENELNKEMSELGYL